MNDLPSQPFKLFDDDCLKQDIQKTTKHLPHQAAAFESSHARLKKLLDEREIDKTKHIKECSKLQLKIDLQENNVLSVKELREEGML